MKRKSILVLAYSISPTRGSEYSVGWNYVEEMSVNNDLVVLYGLAGDHMGDVDEVENSRICQDMPNVKFIPVRPNFMANLLNTLNRKGVFVYTFYFAYKLWHKQAYRAARGIIEHQPIDLIHYLCPIGYREPGYLWKLDKPYIWGPIGGVMNRPAGIMLDKSLFRGLIGVLRNIVNTLQFRYSKRVKSALARSDLLLASTSETKRMLHDEHGIDSVHLPENAIRAEMLGNQRLAKVLPNECLNIIWVGGVDERKSLDILLTALSHLKDGNWHLYVVGSGPLTGKCMELSRQLGVAERITWVGSVSRETVNSYYARAHLHAITSLMEGNPTVIWEAMSFGVPTITLDHCGMHDTVCDACGIKIPVGTLEQTVHRYADSLDRLISNPHLITDLSRGVFECSRNVTWDQRRIHWETFYQSAVDSWTKKRLQRAG